jgi:hypothetical protein
MGDSRRRLREFPDAVRFEIGHALYQAGILHNPPALSLQSRKPNANSQELIADG